MAKRIPWLLGLFLFLPLFSRAQTDFRLLVRGQEIPVESYQIQDRVLFLNVQDPGVAQIASLLGGSIVWYSERETVSLIKQGRSALLSSSRLEIDGKTASLSVPGLLREKNNSTFYLSLNAIAKAFGDSLVFDQPKKVWYLDPLLTGFSIQAVENRLEITAAATGPVEPEVTRVPYSNRIIVDFPFAVLSPKLEIPTMPANALFEELRLHQFQAKPNIVRAVFVEKEKQEVEWDTKLSSEKEQFSLSFKPAVNGLAFLQLPQKAENQSPRTGPSQLLEIVAKTERNASAETFAAAFRLDAPVHYEWHQLQPPDNRLYLDLSDCKPAIRKPPVYNTSLLSEIKVSQFAKEPVPVARIVFDLRASYATEIHATPDGFQVTVQSAVTTASLPASGAGESGGIFPTAAGNPAELTPARPNGIRVVIDPGHGGSDPGARGGGLVEKELTLDIALRLRSLLVERGFSTTLTRTEDRDVLGYRGSAKSELQARADVGNRAHAALLVSVHINSAEAGWPQGVETHWYKAMDLPLATAIQRRLGGESGFEDRGILRNRYYILIHTSMPAVLAELGFLSNGGDVAKLSQPEYRQRLAQSLADGISDYTHTSSR